jgi:hypothetical protein
MPRYVILEHDHPLLHWDFMLEAGEVLRTWRLESPPEAGRDMPAVASFDHRREYLDYEGPVSAGRGRVVRWDAGSFHWLEEGAERVVVRLEGKRVQATVILTRTGAAAWSCSFVDRAS